MNDVMGVISCRNALNPIIIFYDRRKICLKILSGVQQMRMQVLIN